MHSWVLARTNRHASWHLLREALAADLSDIHPGSTRKGIHLGAMAGTADILQRCYTGLETRGDALWLNPLLPQPLTRLDFDLRYRGHWLRCHCSQNRLSITALPSAAPPVTIIINGQAHTLTSGAHVSVPLAPDDPAQRRRRAAVPARRDHR